MLNIFLVGFVIAGLIIFIFLRKQFPGLDTYWKNGVIWAGLGFALIHFGLHFFLPNFYSQWSGLSTFIPFQIILAVGLYLTFGFKNDANKKFLPPIGKILVLLGVICVGWDIWTAFWMAQDTFIVVDGEPSKKLPQQNEEGEAVATKFWEKHLPHQSALGMLRIIRRKSGFNHLESDGRRLYRGDPKNPAKIGINQIDQNRWWETAREQGLDLEKRDDNNLFALWLYEHKGGFTEFGGTDLPVPNPNKSRWERIKEWFPSSPSPQTPTPIGPIKEFVAIKDWGDEQGIGETHRIHYIPEKSVEIRDPSNPSQIFHDGDAQGVHQKLQFRSIIDKPVIVQFFK